MPWLFRKLFTRSASFDFNNRAYSYFSHPYNGIWMNERAVEIPLMWEQVAAHPPETVLEVGNVLSHYFKSGHLVVDKYERMTGVIAADILDFEPPRKFDCIVSISTLEHVGWDEAPRVPGKHIQAIKRMREWLSPDGKMFATISLGYNPTFDADLFSGKLDCVRVSYFKRVSQTVWQLSGQGEVLDASYGKKFRTTDGLAVCVWNW